uniref:(3R)-3-hydroxyacyl-CoA dehydrogenase n=2 Tax=Clastoptera arizonana TaxID=38151 RepID=A0A1B6BXV6_9HEMI
MILALVTGGGSGIGRATCLRLAKDSAKVIVTDCNESSMNKTLKLLPGEGHMSLLVDVTDYSKILSALKDITNHYYEPPNVLVNSAGILRDSLLLKMSSDMFRQVIDVNLNGTFNAIHAFCQTLVELKKPGSIINISSVAGQMGNIGQCNYSASKAAVESLTKTVAREMGKYNIRCNSVVPGFIKGQMTDGIPDKVKEMFKAQIPLQRFGNAEEVAEVIAFLASNKSSYINGANIPITGGFR